MTKVVQEKIYKKEDNETLATEIIQRMREKNIKFILFYGPLGVGKTTMIRQIIKGLGGTEEGVTSPTYLYVNEYETHNEKIYHADFYRFTLDSPVPSFSFSEFLEGSGIFLMEWPHIVSHYLHHEKKIIVHLQYAATKGRKFTLKEEG